MTQHGGRLGYRPALDGFRGLAVFAVLIFHAGFGWAPGGFLGVTAFFVLSGFLITSLLLVERSATGRIDLPAFWARRARRLVPAALVLLALTVGYAAVADTTGGVVGDGIAAAGWVANWRFIFADQSYEALFADPSPFQHTWSLAIEEQFYVVLPLAAALLLGRRRRFAVVVLVAVAASTAAAALLHDGGTAGRAYYGTDARVAEPLVGVLLALALSKRGGLKEFPRRGRVVLDAVAAAALVGLGFLMLTVDDASDALYRGGFLLAAVLAAAVVAACTQPATLTARAFSARPLVRLGRVSYGVYLFHWPVFLWLSERRTGLPQASLFAVRCAVTLALAAASYVLLEQPVRAGRIRGRIGAVGWANATVGLLAGLMLVTAVAPANTVSLFASGEDALAPPPVTTPSTAPGAPTTATASSAAQGRRTTSSTPHPAKSAVRASATRSTSTSPSSHDPEYLDPNAPVPTPPTPPPTTPQGPGAPEAPKLRVAVVGDSMSMNLAAGLEAWAEHTSQDIVVYSLGMGGCPLSRGGVRRIREDGDYHVPKDCDWWSKPESTRFKNLRAFDPDLVIAQDGVANVPDRKLPEWSEYRSLGDPRFDAWLSREYSDVQAAFQGLGAVVLSVNGACADWKQMWNLWSEFEKDGVGDQRVRHYNALMDMREASGAWTADLFGRLCPNGEFVNEVDGVKNARPDGFHLSPEASEALAANWLGPLVLQVSPKPR